MKSRRGAPKRVNTEGFDCPNRTCLYFGITDASIHALVGDGKHGKTERIPTPGCGSFFCTCFPCARRGASRTSQKGLAPGIASVKATNGRLRTDYHHWFKGLLR